MSGKQEGACVHTSTEAACLELILMETRKHQHILSQNEHSLIFFIDLIYVLFIVLCIYAKTSVTAMQCNERVK